MRRSRLEGHRASRPIEIRSGTVSITGGLTTADATITQVVPGDCELILTGVAWDQDGNTDSTSSFGYLTFVSGTTIRGTRNGNTGVLTLGWELRIYPKGAIRMVREGTITLSAVASNTATIATTFRRTARLQHLGNTTDDVSGSVARCITRVDVTSETVITASKGVAGGVCVVSYRLCVFAD